MHRHGPGKVAERITVLLLVGIVLLLITACDTTPRQPDLPGDGMAVVPTLVTIERRHYVPVPEALTAPEPIATGEIAEVFAVAAERRAALERANARLREIAEIQGTQPGAENEGAAP